MKTDIMICGCGDPAHHLLFTLDEDAPQVWLHYQLLLEPWYKRIWYGVRYIFGHQSRYGAYGELVINESNVDKLQQIIEHVHKPISDTKLSRVTLPLVDPSKIKKLNEGR